jgi:hypothetical protein
MVVKCGFESGVGELVDAEGTEQGIIVDASDKVRAADEDAALRSAEELVAAGSNEVDAVLDGRAQGGLACESEMIEAREQAGSLVFENGNAEGSCESDEIAEGGALHKAFNTEIRLMHAKEERGLLVDGVFVVGDPGAVGGADFAEKCAGLLEDFRDTEATPDFDEFAAGDNDFTFFGKGVQGEEGCSGAVVDDDDAVSLGIFFRYVKNAEDEALGVDIAAAAFTGFEIELEVGVAAGDFADVGEGGFAQRRAAEVGVEDDTCSVDDGAEGVLRAALEGCGDLCRKGAELGFKSLG